MLFIFNNEKTNGNTTTATQQEREVRQVDRWVEFSGQGPCGAEAPELARPGPGSRNQVRPFRRVHGLRTAAERRRFLWASLSPTG